MSGFYLVNTLALSGIDVANTERTRHGFSLKLSLQPKISSSKFYFKVMFVMPPLDKSETGISEGKLVSN